MTLGTAIVMYQWKHIAYSTTVSSTTVFWSVCKCLSALTVVLSVECLVRLGTLGYSMCQMMSSWNLYDVAEASQLELLHPLPEIVCKCLFSWENMMP